MIKILFLSANPKDSTPLRLEEEARAIDKKLEETPFRRTFEFVPVFALRVSDLQQHLMRYSPQIVHFSGHGSSTGEIILEDGAGNCRAVPIDGLKTLFALEGRNVVCVVLNACSSEGQASAIAAHIPFVIGMSGAIGAEAALSFAVAFYQALGYGRTIWQALELAKCQIQLDGLPGHGVPTLISKEGADARAVCLAEAPAGESTEKPGSGSGRVPETDRGAESEGREVVAGSVSASGEVAGTVRLVEAGAVPKVAAIQPAHWMRYAVGLVALAGVLATVGLLATDWRVAVREIVLIILSLAGLFGVARLTRVPSVKLHKVIVALVWLTAGLLVSGEVSSISLKWPVDLGSWVRKVSDAPKVSRYAWSRQREVYHYANCCWVKRISPENLMTGDAAPQGRGLHSGCPTVEGTDGCTGSP